MKIFSPRLVLSSGMGAAGKSTTCKEIVRRIANAFYLDRDDIVPGILHVALTDTQELLPFEEYVAHDTVFPDHVHTVDTVFGPMLQVHPRNAFHRRHGRDQSYLIQMSLAATGLTLGKIPLLDCFLARQINDGTFRRFVEQPLFAGYPKYHIHFVADLNTCYERVRERLRHEPGALTRSAHILNRDAFDKEFSVKHPRIPAGLLNGNYLLMDTTNRSPEECAEECVAYISSD